MRVVFMGTPDFSVPVLTEILGQGHEVCAVYTRAPQPAGRGMELRPSPVHRTAAQFGIPVFTPKSLRTAEAQAEFAGHGADCAVVVAYGLILPKPILEAPRLGCFNLHASLLPRWRGAAPIQRAIMAGDAETGVMVMQMDEGLDTGAIGMAEKIAIGPEMTAGELHDALSRIGADLTGRALSAISRGSLAFRPQPDEGVTYAAKIDKAEAKLDFGKPAPEVHNLARGLSPFPGAWFEADFGRGPERVKVLRTRVSSRTGTAGTYLGEGAVACATGAVELVQVQRGGKAPMAFADFARGARLRAGREARLMPRYKLTIEYDGRPFVGWQRQANGLSVQEAVERGIESLTGAFAPIQAAGRTDAGVHAKGQVVHVDLARDWRGDRLRDALNAHLRLFPIAIVNVERVDETFEARFSATKRHYLYRILNRRAPPVHERGFVWHVARRLDAAAMHEAAQALVGRHDFTTFRAAECQANSPVRTLERLDVTRSGADIEIRASALSFLHHQVRSIVGSLEHVGSGKWSAADLKAALDAADRARCGAVAPSSGLFLMQVDY